MVLGIAGGSGSGKSWLARELAEAFEGRASVLCHDWYYKNNAELAEIHRRKLNFDHPAALETPLMARDIDRLLGGETVEAPVYDYARHARLKETRRVEPRPLLIVEGILILHEARLRRRLSSAVFIDVPDDIRLLRRIRRDTLERRVDLVETLRLYQDFVRPMHQRFVQPSSRHADRVWRQLEDRRFPARLVSSLRRRLG